MQVRECSLCRRSYPADREHFVGNKGYTPTLQFDAAPSAEQLKIGGEP